MRCFTKHSHTRQESLFGHCVIRACGCVRYISLSKITLAALVSFHYKQVGIILKPFTLVTLQGQ